MDLSPDVQIIHERARLRIIGLLYRENDLGFATIRQALGLTAGNLASHATKLEEAGLVASRDALTRGGFERRMQITAEGVARFERYMVEIEAFLAFTRGPAPAPAPPATTSRAAAHVTRATIALGGLFVLGEGVQQWLSDTSGSSYLGILVSGALLALVPALGHLPQWLAGRRGP